MDNKLMNCRVCGLTQDDLPWGIDGNSPNYEICDCCGVEFGNEDYKYESVLKYRENWIKKGMLWFNKKNKPLEWDFEKQFSSIVP
jgi:hypothetical protein